MNEWRLSDDPGRTALVTLYLRNLRILRDITQQDAADAIRLSVRQFGRWEDGESEQLRGTQLIALTQVIGADLEHLAYLLSDYNQVDPQIALALAHAQADVIPLSVRESREYLESQLDQARPRLGRPLQEVATWIRGLKPRQRTGRSRGRASSDADE